ncbi:MAG: hypothetical protein AAGE85_01525 [Pseudomonadota bacterium]
MSTLEAVNRSSSRNLLGWVAAAMVGAVIGGAAVYYDGKSPPEPRTEDGLRDLKPASVMSHGAAVEHRATQYHRLAGVNEIISLPTHFMRLDATYALAGRSDSARLQKLVLDVDRLADDQLRFAMLEVLFLALTEIEPATALALAVADGFEDDRRIEHLVWEAWSRRDFEQALVAAKAQYSAKRASAARGLYIAHGIAGNAKTERIELELGIGPDRELRRVYLLQLANEDLLDTIDYVNGLGKSLHRREAIAWLSAYLPSAQLDSVLAVADTLNDPRDSRELKRAVSIRVAEEDPAGVLERAIAAGTEQPNFHELERAMEMLIAEDLELTKAFLERARLGGNVLQLNILFVEQLASIDPQAALVWAKQNDGKVGGRSSSLLRTALATVAETAPGLAFDEALKLSKDIQQGVIFSIIRTVADDDPQSALELLGRIPSAERRKEASGALVGQWINLDPDAALDWALAQEAGLSRRLLGNALRQILRKDIQAAMRNLERMPEDSQSAWRLGIAAELARRGLTEEAQDFARQFEGQPGHDEIRAAIAIGFADDDPEFARSIAEQTVSGDTRDRILGQMLQYSPGMSGQELDARLGEIANRSVVTARVNDVVGKWFADDPVAATAWVNEQPGGFVRDSAIIGIARRAVDPEDSSVNRLIDSMNDPAMRAEAKVAVVMHFALTDPTRADALLLDDDIPVSVRARLTNFLNRY